MTSTIKNGVLLLVAAGLVGCSGARSAAEPPDGAPPATTSDLGAPPDLAPPPDLAHKADYAGVFATVTPIDLTQNGVLPGAIGPALSALIELHDHPGDAILDLVAAADIPALSDLVKGLPGFVHDLLAAALDKLIIDELYANVPVADQIAGLISGISELANSIAIHETLTVHGPQTNGATTIDQQVTGVGFTLLGQSTQITLDSLAQNAAHAQLVGTITPHADAPVADADLTLAGGTLTLPLGQLLLQAASPLLFAPLGAVDLQGALTNLVPCAAAAQSLSDEVDGLVSAATIDQVCTAALDIVAATVTGEIDKLVLTGVRVDDGSAWLLDVSQSHPVIDYQADRIENGKWTWSFTVAGQTIRVPSTIVADRVGTAQ